MKVNIILNMIKLYHIDRRNHSELWNIGVILTNIRNKQRWLLPPLFCNVLLEILTTVLYESEIRVKTIRKVETKLSLFANDRINIFRQRVQTRTCGINKKIQQNIWLKDQYPEAISFYTIIFNKKLWWKKYLIQESNQKHKISRNNLAVIWWKGLLWSWCSEGYWNGKEWNYHLHVSQITTWKLSLTLLSSCFISNQPPSSARSAFLLACKSVSSHPMLPLRLDPYF